MFQTSWVHQTLFLVTLYIFVFEIQELYDSATHLLDGTVGFVHQHVDMTDFDVKLDGGGTVSLTYIYIYMNPE